LVTELTRWILVAGTGQRPGHPADLPPAVYWSARAMGRKLAPAGYGLVGGGWSGVDYVTAEAFQTELRAIRKPLSNYLTQVVSRGWQPDFKGGHIVYVEPGPQGWVECVNYADAVVLIGGVGGTYETYLYATQELRPVFPLAGTGGDAQRALTDILAHWDNLPMDGISHEVFRDVLGREISSEQDAERIVNDLIALLDKRFTFLPSDGQRRKGLVFISYSHEDRIWLNKLQTMLRPLERKGKISVWADTEIEAGVRWMEEIRTALHSASVAVFLVSPVFLASDFINEIELPELLVAAKKNNVRVMWILVSASLYEETGLRNYQAAHDISQPLDQLSPARQNEVLVSICRKIEEACGGSQ
jgi:TIR domain